MDDECVTSQCVHNGVLFDYVLDVHVDVTNNGVLALFF